MLEITADQLKQKLQAGENFHFFDVREAWEHEEENIGALNLPLPEIPHRLTQIEALKDQPIVVHCVSGNRGLQAQLYLKQQGFKHVWNLVGGMESYLSLEEA